MDQMIHKSKLDDLYDKAFIDDPQHIYLVKYPCRYFSGKMAALYDCNKIVPLSTINAQRMELAASLKMHNTFLHKKGIELVCEHVHAFSPDGTHIVMDDGFSISEYYIAGDQLIRTLMLREREPLYSVNYSPDGWYLVTITRTDGNEDDYDDGPSIIEVWQSNIYGIHNKCARTIQRYWRTARHNPRCVLGKRKILKLSDI
jgi:hypothetical protein